MASREGATATSSREGPTNHIMQAFVVTYVNFGAFRHHAWYTIQEQGYSWPEKRACILLVRLECSFALGGNDNNIRGPSTSEGGVPYFLSCQAYVCAQSGRNAIHWILHAVFFNACCARRQRQMFWRRRSWSEEEARTKNNSRSHHLLIRTWSEDDGLKPLQRSGLIYCKRSKFKAQYYKSHDF